MKPTLLVLAAGMGSRYGGLKQIDPVGPSGEIIIDYSIHDALAAGFGKVVFVIRRDIEYEFKKHVGERYESLTDVRYAFQELDDLPAGFTVPDGRVKPWGTGHAVLTAKSAIDEPFAVINADDFYGGGGYRLLAERLSSARDVDGSGDYCMTGFTLRNTLSDHGSVSRGICRTGDEGFLEDVEEITNIERDGDGARYVNDAGTAVKLTGDEIASMNMWGFTPSIFDHLSVMFEAFLRERGAEPKSEFFIPTVVNELITSGQATVKVMESPDSWFGITYREDKEKVVASVAELVEDGTYSKKLFSH